MYNPKSLKAEEFISDEEIRETLAYADANKDNVELIDQILAKAKECKGLTHREASVLLACEMPGFLREKTKSGPDFFASGGKTAVGEDGRRSRPAKRSAAGLIMGAAGARKGNGARSCGF